MKDKVNWPIIIGLVLILICVVAWVQDGVLHSRIDKLEAEVTELKDAITRIETATDKMVEAIRVYEEAR